MYAMRIAQKYLTPIIPFLLSTHFLVHPTTTNHTNHFCWDKSLLWTNWRHANFYINFEFIIFSRWESTKRSCCTKRYMGWNKSLNWCLQFSLNLKFWLWPKDCPVFPDLTPVYYCFEQYKCKMPILKNMELMISSYPQLNATW